MNNIYLHESKLNFDDACALPAKLNKDKHLGFDDWVLPNVKQLQMLYLSGLVDSTYGHWSSSPYVGNSYGAWYVNFNNGNVYCYGRDNIYHVRLVRASQLFDIGKAADRKVMGESE